MAAGGGAQRHAAVVGDAVEAHAAVGPGLAGALGAVPSVSHNEVYELHHVQCFAVTPHHVLPAARGAAAAHVGGDPGEACKQELTLCLTVHEVPGLAVVDQGAQRPAYLVGPPVPRKLHDAGAGMLAHGGRRQEDVHGDVHAVGHADVHGLADHAVGELQGLVASFTSADAQHRVPVPVRVPEVVGGQLVRSVCEPLGAAIP
mmetsp:Transcript_9235/g.25860  ORF Transcript_9235/g.25860 Transcript_9235/m.25860 type:complete len:202 (+) Transcript_9235:656-1261(+)